MSIVGSRLALALAASVSVALSPFPAFSSTEQVVAPGPADPASAAVDATAFAHYQAGRYAQAVTIALEVGGADNLALAARAMNAVGYFEEGRKAARDAAQKAYEYASAAIAEDPDHVEAHLQSAISLSVRAGNMAAGRAFVLGLPKRSREEIDAALRLDPDNIWALSTSGTWRIEIARRGAARVYGADPDEGFQELMEARRLAPGNVVIAYETAVSLLAMKRDDWRPIALDSLEDAINGEPTTVFEGAVRDLAVRFKAAIAEGGEAERAFIDEQR